MPLTPEQERIKRLWEGDPSANRQAPAENAPALGPQDYQQPESRPSTPQMQYSSNKPYSAQGSSQYYDAIQNRFNSIAGIGSQATERSLAAAQQKAAADYAARQAAANAAGNDASYSGGDYTPTKTGNAARDSIINSAKGALGLPYAWGGGTSKGASYGIGRGTSNLKGFDCSGLVLYAYSKIGIKMSHSAGAQAKMGVRMPINKLSPGDLVGKPGHIAIYAGNGMMYEAPTFGKRVRLVPVRSGMFGVHFKL